MCLKVRRHVGLLGGYILLADKSRQKSDLLVSHRRLRFSSETCAQTSRSLPHVNTRLGESPFVYLADGRAEYKLVHERRLKHRHAIAPLVARNARSAHSAEKKGHVLL